MKYAIYNAAGEILRVGDSLIPNAQVGRREYLYLGDNATLDHWIDLSGAAPLPVAKGPRPTIYHAWDTPTKTWQPNLPFAKTAKKNAIEAERDRRITAVIVYSATNYDADPGTIDRVGKKLHALNIHNEKGTSPTTARMVWRDHNDVTHSFATLADYRNFLQGLAEAIDDRGTDAWNWSWTAKGQVDAATTLADLDAISLV